LLDLYGSWDTPLRHANRAQRSDGRETECQVLWILLHTADFASRECIYQHQTGQIYGQDNTWLSERLGMGRRRLQRAINALVDRGLLEVDSRAIAKPFRARSGWWTTSTRVLRLSWRLLRTLKVDKGWKRLAGESASESVVSKSKAKRLQKAKGRLPDVVVETEDANAAQIDWARQRGEGGPWTRAIDMALARGLAVAEEVFKLAVTFVPRDEVPRAYQAYCATL
jgi:hypothetical protein